MDSVVAIFSFSVLIDFWHIDDLPGNPDTPPIRIEADWWVLYGKRARAITVATVHPIKPRTPLESFLFEFSCPGEGRCPGGLGGHLSLILDLASV